MATRRTSPLLVGLLAVTVLAAGGSWGYSWWQARQRHLAAVAHCGKADFARFDAELAKAREEFDRVDKVAGVTPRVSLAPVLLRLSDAQAAVQRLVPPPCAKPGFARLAEGLRLQVEWYALFAGQAKASTTVAVDVEKMYAMTDGEKAIAAARERAVAD